MLMLALHKDICEAEVQPRPPEINLPAISNLTTSPSNLTISKNMPPFALPLPANSYAPLPRPSFLPHQLPRRKRKRASSDSPDEKSSPEPESDYTHASTNPLSLTPAEIAQYRLAGLELDDELPDQGVDGVKGFPHRALPILSDAKEAKAKREREKGKEVAREDEDDTDVTSRQDYAGMEHKSIGPGLHLRHMSVLTTILHRCLLAGDIPRASRAWGDPDPRAVLGTGY